MTAGSSTLHTICDEGVFKHDWLVSVELKDACFHIPVIPTLSHKLSDI